MYRFRISLLIAFLSAFPVLAADTATESPVRPIARDPDLPRTRWENQPGSALWTRSALSSLKGHADILPQIVPRDIQNWCPGYVHADDARRRAFWVGLISTLAKHESTYNPGAVGGGGLWYGLVQILPATARGYKCNVGTGEALKHGPSNLSCALRIMTRTVKRDGVVSEGMRGVAADWGPFHSRRKRTDMIAWMRQQPYCKALSAVRPQLRPELQKINVENAEAVDTVPNVNPIRPETRPQAGPVRPKLRVVTD